MPFKTMEEPVNHLLPHCKDEIVVGITFLSIWHHQSDLGVDEGRCFELEGFLG